MGGMRSVGETEIDNLLSPDPAKRSLELRRPRDAFVPRLATINRDNDRPMLRRLAAPRHGMQAPCHVGNSVGSQSITRTRIRWRVGATR
jgi:hypothetical protein